MCFHSVPSLLPRYLFKSLFCDGYHGIKDDFMRLIPASQKPSNGSEFLELGQGNSRIIFILTYGAIALGSKRIISATNRVFSMNSMADFMKSLLCAKCF